MCPTSSLGNSTLPVLTEASASRGRSRPSSTPDITEMGFPSATSTKSTGLVWTHSLRGTLTKSIVHLCLSRTPPNASTFWAGPDTQTETPPVQTTPRSETRPNTPWTRSISPCSRSAPNGLWDTPWCNTSYFKTT